VREREREREKGKERESNWSRERERERERDFQKFKRRAKQLTINKKCYIRSQGEKEE
jgi:hypothetical protein